MRLSILCTVASLAISGFTTRHPNNSIAKHRQIEVDSDSEGEEPPAVRMQMVNLNTDEHRGGEEMEHGPKNGNQ